jgi:hypothetical protein
LTHIESRPAKKGPTYDFFVDIEGASNEPRVKALLSELKDKCFNVTVMGSKEVPWFPRKMSDIDLISQNVLGAGAELESDHPGFNVRACRLSLRASKGVFCIVYHVSHILPIRIGSSGPGISPTPQTHC